MYAVLFMVSGFLVFAGHMVADGPNPTILMYHGVGDPSIKLKTMNIPMDAFEKQMAFFHRHNYHVISLDELVTLLKGKKRAPFKTIVLTFDDGYEDNYTRAYPVLKKYGFPATFFLVTSFLEGEQVFSGAKVKFLTRDQIREMMSSGLVTFGSHSKNHLFLPFLNDDLSRMGDEIAGSKNDLERLLGRPVKFFCYPRGGYNDDAKKLVREAGYDAAVTTFPREKGYALNDIWALKRVKMSESCVNPTILFLETSGYYPWLKETSS
jgi:peptidoglycan/xylan/chitin deacetylase (PgdA/CDA1 family)